jgi:hypothetical protein
MAQRPSFDMAKLTTADKILLGGALLLFIDSFLSWQRVCTPSAVSAIIGKICVGASAWGGNGGFAGVLMAIFALLLLAGSVAMLSGVNLPVTLPMSTVLAGLTGGTVLFGVIKFLFVVANHAALGAWIGLILILAVAYGGYMKMQEQKAIPPSSGFTAPPPPPPAP